MMAVRFGGVDSCSLSFLNKFPDLFIAYWLHSDQQAMIGFIGENWVAKGGRGFYGPTPEFLEDVRLTRLKELEGVSDEEIYLAIHYAVCRVRRYAHIKRLQEGRVCWARIRAFGCQTQTCQQLHDKTFKVELASKAIEFLLSRSRVEQGLELAKRVISPKSPAVIKHVLEGAAIKDAYVLNNYAFPPFYPGCQCVIEGVIET